MRIVHFHNSYIHGSQTDLDTSLIFSIKGLLPYHVIFEFPFLYINFSIGHIPSAPVTTLDSNTMPQSIEAILFNGVSNQT